MKNSAIGHKKRKKIKITSIILSLLLICYFFMQWYLINRNKIETVKATEGFINDSIFSLGIVCRDEIILTDEINGIIHFNIENAQRVSKNMKIGDVYSNALDLENLNKLRLLEEQLANLNIAQNFMNNTNVDISSTRKQLNNNIINLSESLSLGNYNEALDLMPDVALGINKINFATSNGGDLDNTKASINQSIESTKQVISPITMEILAPYSGYFIKGIDGYEDIATVENFKNLSHSEGIAALARPPQGELLDYYGKIITDYKWNLCAYVTANQAEKFKIGTTVKLSLDTQQEKYQNATVDYIDIQGETALIVFKGSVMDEKSASVRVSNCEILFKKFSGIKVPKSALHILNGELGVYVKFSKLVQFKKVDPIYEDSNYILLPLNVSKVNEVKLFDDIIVKGINLYDGKYL